MGEVNSFEFGTKDSQLVKMEGWQTLETGESLVHEHCLRMEDHHRVSDE